MLSQKLKSKRDVNLRKISQSNKKKSFYLIFFVVLVFILKI